MSEEAAAVEKTRKPATFSFYRRLYPFPSGAYRHLFSALLLLLLLAGATALVLYLVYRPSKPRFSVPSVAIYAINSTATPSFPPSSAVSASIRFTFVTRNPSDRTTILYDRLSLYAAYRGHPITPPLSLPPLTQDRRTAVAASPVVGGGWAVPVPPEVAAALEGDKANGVVGIRMVVVGRIKYKSGPFRSGWKGLYVRCDVLVGLRTNGGGQVPLLGEPDCHVDD